MESPRHQRLKHLSLAFLRAAGCAAAATEVRCPASRFRTDAAGFADPLLRGSAGRSGSDLHPAVFSVRVHGRATSVLIECKQSRADFLRDNRRLDELLSERRELERRRVHLEECLIRNSEPHLLGSGTMLFAEMEPWDFAASRSPTYRGVLRDLRRLDKAIHGDTKFWTIARYALADVMLIAAPAGLVRAGELPSGWGLLEFPGAWLEAPAEPEACDDPYGAVVRLHAANGAGATREAHRVRLLRNIAVAATGRGATSERANMSIRVVQPVGNEEAGA